MKKAAITFTIATMLATGLVGCGPGQQAVDDTAQGPRATQLGRTAPYGYGDTAVPRTGGTIGQDVRGDAGAGTIGLGAQGRTGTGRTGLGAQGGTRMGTTGFGAQGDQEDQEDEAQTRRYTDVGTGNTHAADIEWATDIGIFKGVGTNQFAPNQALTRAQASTLFKRMAEQGYITIPDETPADTPADEEETTGEETPADEEGTTGEDTPAGDTTPADEDTVGGGTTD